MTGEVRVISMRQAAPDGFERLDCTSRNPALRYQLSPFFLGPVECYRGLTARNMENAWQYAKLYPAHADADGVPTGEYFAWRDAGWAKSRADRRPMGHLLPLCSLWVVDGEERYLDYIEARKEIYIPLYARSVLAGSGIISDLRARVRGGAKIALADFDGYDHKSLGMTYDEVVHDPTRRMGHGFVVAMLLEGHL